MLAVLALFLGQALASPTFAALEACSTTCPDDGPDGRCGPICIDCTCCTHAARPLAANPVVPIPPTPPAREIVADEGPAPRATNAQDVFHVPRSNLA